MGPTSSLGVARRWFSGLFSGSNRWIWEFFAPSRAAGLDGPSGAHQTSGESLGAEIIRRRGARNDNPRGAHQGWCAGRLCSSSGSPGALPGVPRVKHMTRRAFSWQSNAQRVIRRRDPFHGTDLGDMYGSAVVFGIFLWNQPLELGIVCAQRCSRTRRTQRCTPDLWGKPGG